jgi:glycosyltransferase involved in cell wall biosynthesis
MTPHHSPGQAVATSAEIPHFVAVSPVSNSTRTAEPLVAVGLAVYNSERFVSRSIECLLAQTYTDFVLFISDNASTDSTGEICRSYASRDPRIRYSRNATNLGMVGNYNLLFSYCKSKYFRWATADDFWEKDMLADAVEVMEADPSIAIAYPRAIIVDEGEKELRRWADKLHLMQDDPCSRFLDTLEYIGLVHHHLGLMRSETVRRTRLLGRHVGSDVGFIAAMSLYGKFYQIPKYQMYRRVHEDSSSVHPEDIAHMRRRYHAARVRHVPFSRWHFHRVLFQAVANGPLQLHEKVRLMRSLLKVVYWDNKRLLRETKSDLGWLLKRDDQ